MTARGVKRANSLNPAVQAVENNNARTRTVNRTESVIERDVLDSGVFDRGGGPPGLRAP